MEVGRRERLRYHGNVLPPPWRTLYELTKLDDGICASALSRPSARRPAFRRLSAPDAQRADTDGDDDHERHDDDERNTTAAGLLAPANMKGNGRGRD